uniref:Jumonji domain-containing protein 4 n=1 Tax=Cacopsylla melanoneura TaxID=428564 RepID=A0A8D8VMP2_9HEMI
MLTLSDHFNKDDLVIQSSTLPQVEYTSDPTNLYPYCFNTFLSENKPFILKSCTKEWACSSEWVLNGHPNFEYISETYGAAKAPVIDCNALDSGITSNTCNKEMTLGEFTNYWQNYNSLNYPCDDPCYYLKDWHFLKNPKSANIYRVPNVFASDWLNEYYSEYLHCKDDYVFSYMGPKNTWTPLHVDVYNSYSWSVNICGSKEWLFLPPGNEKYFKDSFGNLVTDMKSVDWSSLPPNTVITVHQDAGDGIFVPSGWHHQVSNMADTISINHNWINGCNIGYIYKELVTQLEAVKKEIDDCKDMDDWEAHCQLMLVATFAMNFEMMFNMLKHISQKRLASLRSGCVLKMYGDWDLGLDHITFDLKQARDVLKMCVLHEDWDSNLGANEIIDELDESL